MPISPGQRVGHARLGRIDLDFDEKLDHASARRSRSSSGIPASPVRNRGRPGSARHRAPIAVINFVQRRLGRRVLPARLGLDVRAGELTDRPQLRDRAVRKDVFGQWRHGAALGRCRCRSGGQSSSSGRATPSRPVCLQARGHALEAECRPCRRPTARPAALFAATSADAAYGTAMRLARLNVGMFRMRGAPFGKIGSAIPAGK